MPLSTGVVPTYRMALPHYWSGLADTQVSTLRNITRFPEHIRDPHQRIVGKHDDEQLALMDELKRQHPGYTEEVINILLYQDEMAAKRAAKKERDTLSEKIDRRTGRQQARAERAAVPPVAVDEETGISVPLTPAVRAWLQEEDPDALAHWHRLLVAAKTRVMAPRTGARDEQHAKLYRDRLQKAEEKDAVLAERRNELMEERAEDAKLLKKHTTQRLNDAQHRHAEDVGRRQERFEEKVLEKQRRAKSAQDRKEKAIADRNEERRLKTMQFDAVREEIQRKQFEELTAPARPRRASLSPHVADRLLRRTANGAYDSDVPADVRAGLTSARRANRNAPIFDATGSASFRAEASASKFSSVSDASPPQRSVLRHRTGGGGKNARIPQSPATARVGGGHHLNRGASFGSLRSAPSVGRSTVKFADTNTGARGRGQRVEQSNGQKALAARGIFTSSSPPNSQATTAAPMSSRSKKRATDATVYSSSHSARHNDDTASGAPHSARIRPRPDHFSPGYASGMGDATSYQGDYASVGRSEARRRRHHTSGDGGSADDEDDVAGAVSTKQAEGQKDMAKFEKRVAAHQTRLEEQHEDIEFESKRKAQRQDAALRRAIEAAEKAQKKNETARAKKIERDAKAQARRDAELERKAEGLRGKTHVEHGYNAFTPGSPSSPRSTSRHSSDSSNFMEHIVRRPDSAERIRRRRRKEKRVLAEKRRAEEAERQRLAMQEKQRRVLSMMGGGHAFSSPQPSGGHKAGAGGKGGGESGGGASGHRGTRFFTPQQRRSKDTSMASPNAAPPVDGAGAKPTTDSGDAVKTESRGTALLKGKLAAGALGKPKPTSTSDTNVGDAREQSPDGGASPEVQPRKTSNPFSGDDDDAQDKWGATKTKSAPPPAPLDDDKAVDDAQRKRVSRQDSETGTGGNSLADTLKRGPRGSRMFATLDVEPPAPRRYLAASKNMTNTAAMALFGQRSGSVVETLLRAQEELEVMDEDGKMRALRGGLGANFSLPERRGSTRVEPDEEIVFEKSRRPRRESLFPTIPRGELNTSSPASARMAMSPGRALPWTPQSAHGYTKSPQYRSPATSSRRRRRSGDSPQSLRSASAKRGASVAARIEATQSHADADRVQKQSELAAKDARHAAQKTAADQERDEVTQDRAKAKAEHFAATSKRAHDAQQARLQHQIEKIEQKDKKAEALLKYRQRVRDGYLDEKPPTPLAETVASQHNRRVVLANNHAGISSPRGNHAEPIGGDDTTQSDSKTARGVTYNASGHRECNGRDGAAAEPSATELRRNVASPPVPQSPSTFMDSTGKQHIAGKPTAATISGQGAGQSSPRALKVPCPPPALPRQFTSQTMTTAMSTTAMSTTAMSATSRSWTQHLHQTDSNSPKSQAATTRQQRWSDEHSVTQQSATMKPHPPTHALTARNRTTHATGEAKAELAALRRQNAAEHDRERLVEIERKRLGRDAAFARTMEDRNDDQAERVELAKARQQATDALLDKTASKRINRTAERQVEAEQKSAAAAAKIQTATAARVDHLVEKDGQRRERTAAAARAKAQRTCDLMETMEGRQGKRAQRFQLQFPKLVVRQESLLSARRRLAGADDSDDY